MRAKRPRSRVVRVGETVLLQGVWRYPNGTTHTVKREVVCGALPQGVPDVSAR